MMQGRFAVLPYTCNNYVLCRKHYEYTLSLNSHGKSFNTSHIFEIEGYFSWKGGKWKTSMF